MSCQVYCKYEVVWMSSSRPIPNRYVSIERIKRKDNSEAGKTNVGQKIVRRVNIMYQHKYKFESKIFALQSPMENNYIFTSGNTEKS